MGDTERHAPSRLAVATAFAAVYIIWGSTYLAIRVAVETIPPFMMAGVRYLIAGGVLYLVARWRGALAPTRMHWRSALIVGGLLLLGGNGGVVWAEQPGRVPSGVAALLVTAVPLWMVLINWLRRGGVRPTGAEVIGLILGAAGVVLLVDPGALTEQASVDRVGAVVLIFAALFWAIGSIYSRHAKLPRSPLLATAMQMLTGGVLLTVASVPAGEWGRFDFDRISGASFLAMAYLIVFGALIGFTAYIWILQVSTPAKVSTYAYVNPVIAVVLGWLILDEPLTWTMIAATCVILSGVVLITTRSAVRASKPPPTAQSVLPAPSASKPIETIRVKEGEYA